MILLAALVGSLFAQRFTHERVETVGGLRRRRRDGQRLSCAAGGQPVYRRILFGTLMLASLGPVVIAAVSALLMTNLLNGGGAPLYLVTPLAAPCRRNTC